MQFFYSVYYELTASARFKHNARNIPIVVCAAPPEVKQIMLEICRGC
jgi:hypothetical protein